MRDRYRQMLFMVTKHTVISNPDRTEEELVKK